MTRVNDLEAILAAEQMISSDRLADLERTRTALANQADTLDYVIRQRDRLAAMIVDLEQRIASARSLVREWQSWSEDDDPNDQPDLDGLLAILDGRDDTAGEV